MNQPSQYTKVFLFIMATNFLLMASAWGESARITPPPVSGRAATPEAIVPADVLARIQLFRGELEAIRFEMGKPKDRRSTRLATDALPHEVYFQAITLFIKADRLALELTGSTGLRPEPVATQNIRPYHNWVLVTAAYNRLMTIKNKLGMKTTASEKIYPLSTKPTEVGRAIVLANRQLNLMLQRRFTSGDVFQQVTWGIEYAKALLGKFPSAALPVTSPPFERGKQPGDVFLRLAECFSVLEEIARLSGMKVLHLDGKAVQQAVQDLDIHPSDVYDLATLLVSDLTYLQGKVNDDTPIPSVPFPGRKFPSHVYQQAGILLTYLRNLEQQVRTDPNWGPAN